MGSVGNDYRVDVKLLKGKDTVVDGGGGGGGGV